MVECGDEIRIVSLTPETVELLCLEHAKHPNSPLIFMHPATQTPYLPQTVRRLHNEIIREAGPVLYSVCRPPHACAALSLLNEIGAKSQPDAGPLQERNDAAELYALLGLPNCQGLEQTH